MLRTLIAATAALFLLDGAWAQARIKYLLESGYSSQNLAYQDVRRQDLLDSRDLARLGDRQAQFNTGAMYHSLGQYNFAVYWYRRAALFRHPMAAYNLGILYYLGEGVDRDLAKAERWLRVASEADYPDAMTQLGIMTYRGELDDEEMTEADWYEAAAYAGEGVAQFNLGVLYLNGTGVEQDPIKAYAWVSLAARELEVDDEVKMLEVMLRPEELAAAQELRDSIEKNLKRRRG